MKIEVLDSTLRDGAQSSDISLSTADKTAVAWALAELGIPLVEAGTSFSTPSNEEFFRSAMKLPLGKTKICVFCSTRRKYSATEKDANILSALASGASVIVVFGKSSQFHVEKIVGCSLEENLAMIEESVAFFTKRNLRVIFDCEHFFDGYKENRDYALECAKAAVKGGADTVCLCDTNGGSFPDDVYHITADAVASLGGVSVGAHCHNDGGLAVANTYSAVIAGAVHIQGTLTGIGERAGNCCLSTVIPDLQIKKNYKLLPGKAELRKLTEITVRVSEILNTALPKSAPFVGRVAFAHKAGTHGDAVIKNPSSFEHISPASVGNERHLLVSELSGRSIVAEKIREIYPDLDKRSPEVSETLEYLKRLEGRGWQFENAEASFVLAVRRIIEKNYESPFKVADYKTVNGVPENSESFSASANVEVIVNGKKQVISRQGKGAVNALDLSLREALMHFYPEIEDMSLTDYKVRVINPKDTTAALVRVLITSTDGNSIWTTTGVSYDVIDASFRALCDSLEYKLTIIESVK